MWVSSPFELLLKTTYKTHKCSVLFRKSLQLLQLFVTSAIKAALKDQQDPDDTGKIAGKAESG